MPLPWPKTSFCCSGVKPVFSMPRVLSRSACCLSAAAFLAGSSFLSSSSAGSSFLSSSSAYLLNICFSSMSRSSCAFAGTWPVDCRASLSISDISIVSLTGFYLIYVEIFLISTGRDLPDPPDSPEAQPPAAVPVPSSGPPPGFRPGVPSSQDSSAPGHAAQAA